MTEPIRLPAAGMLNALDLTAVGAEAGIDRFQGPSVSMPHGRVFGGQVLAQSILAAMRTVDESRVIHSIHGYFLRPGDDQLPIDFGVDRIHDGRSFSTRRAQAYQHGKPILSLIASFQTEDEGLDHQASMPEGLPEPESLPGIAEQLASLNSELATRAISAAAFDLRHVPSRVGADGAAPPIQAVWMKSLADLPDDPNLHRAALAYGSDYTLLEPVLRRHGIPWLTEGLKIASLDHAMWWHRFARADDWLLYVQESPSASGGRGLAVGRMFTRDGVLVASVAQEGMIRLPQFAHDAQGLA
ncbi:acyl-CoA thioesterase II [Salinibacterium sp. ZJ454]|uniref:acyl-CoA thioesterase n=1 Tax=Salinibacterium sp. ZJ454 TaxID=2708339 RepID=UPI001FB90460|nr:acyl-CoA thioesterase II [Salinibacterium sp. ZJ454]